MKRLPLPRVLLLLPAMVEGLASLQKRQSEQAWLALETNADASA